MEEEKRLKELALDMFDIGVFKFGKFIKRRSVTSVPIYFELLRIISYPHIMSRLARALWKLNTKYMDKVRIYSTLYTAASSLAILISSKHNIAMLMKREEESFDTGKPIEGEFSPGDDCVIITDTMTSGSNILETTNALKRLGLNVKEVYVIIDMDRGGRKNLRTYGIKIKSLYVASELIKYLLTEGKIKKKTADDISYWLKKELPLQTLHDVHRRCDRLKLQYIIRSRLAKNCVGSKLLKIMHTKQSNICLVADTQKKIDILKMAHTVGPYICVFQLHTELVQDFDEEFILNLKGLSKYHKFLLMEDRKYNDIGHIVSLQYTSGIFKISEFFDLITVHAMNGASVLDALKSDIDYINEPRGVFLVGEMDCKAKFKDNYLNATISMAENSDLVVGVMCQSSISLMPGLIQLITETKQFRTIDDLAKPSNKPEHIMERGADLVAINTSKIRNINRGVSAIKKYKQTLWTLYLERKN